jgi:hypothetical protein
MRLDSPPIIIAVIWAASLTASWLVNHSGAPNHVAYVLVLIIPLCLIYYVLVALIAWPLVIVVRRYRKCK